MSASTRPDGVRVASLPRKGGAMLAIHHVRGGARLVVRHGTETLAVVDLAGDELPDVVRALCEVSGLVGGE